MHKKYKILISLFLSLLIILAFTPPLNPPAGGWYQQFMPNIGNRQINDIYFLDSLTGWAVTNSPSLSDTGFILKTTNSGNNWWFVYGTVDNFSRIFFLNQTTGFASGGDIYRTTNGGGSWTLLNAPNQTRIEDMFILNEDTIWFVDSEGAFGGVFRTSNGGINWEQQFTYLGQNPTRIYMYNARIGFINNTTNAVLRRTTNGGVNWTEITDTDGFVQMYFVDSLTGWKSKGDTMKFTSNGGFNWVRQILPYGGIIGSNVMTRFAALNRDTLWGCGGWVQYPNGQYRGIIYRTVNGGINWLFQIPDTTIHIATYELINFTNKRHGWVYSNYPTYVTGIHTTIGGNDTFYIGLKQISNIIPKHFRLYQNYPNPFNPRTVIKYEIVNSKEQIANVKLIVYEITGKEIIKLVDAEQHAGTYEVDFSGNGLSSGIYFYRITVTDDKSKQIYTDTRKMILLK